MGKAAAIAGAIAVVAGGAAIGYSVTRTAAGGMSEVQTAAMARAVAQLEGEIKAASIAVHERARSLSAPLAVHAAIVTDTATVDDLVNRGDFVPAPGEALELGRMDKTTSRLEVLLPRGATGAAHDGQLGNYVELAGDRLVITEVVGVDPTEQANRYTGFLTVRRSLALAPALKPLVDAGITGKFVLGDAAMAIGTMPAGATTREQPLGDSGGAQGPKLIVAEPPPHAVMPMPVLIAGIAAAAIGVVLLALGALSRRAPAQALALDPRVTQATIPPTASLGSARTQLAPHGVAGGTPPLIDPASSVQIVPSNLGPGAMIGRWEIVRRLGSGGMADVYLAQARGDGGFEKLVAVKVMHGHLARNQRAVDHFLDEARLAARIHHPNVVAIQDLGKIGNDYVIVMEYVEGVDLERLLISARAAGRPVPLAVALGILCRICDGLDAAHRATDPDGTPLGIIHRDVKSANVLVSRQGSVKIVDFGIAKAIKQVHFTAVGEFKGTPAMMAPEQRVGGEVDVRADVYSVAAVGYELVTGHGVNLDLAALAHLGVDNWPHLPTPSSLRAGLPGELDELLLHAMAYDRERRPADCAAFGMLCEAVMTRHSLSASDKDIARWADSELRQLAPSLVDAGAGAVKTPSA